MSREMMIAKLLGLLSSRFRGFLLFCTFCAVKRLKGWVNGANIWDFVLSSSHLWKLLFLTSFRDPRKNPIYKLSEGVPVGVSPLAVGVLG